MNKSKVEILIGTSGWMYDHWKGVFYPDKLPKTKWFEYYAAKFSTVEVNATFYRFFKDQTYYKWRDNSPKNFVYVLKAPKLISHRKYLLGVEREIKDFCHSVSLLDKKFGIILLQLAPQTPYDPDRLRSALLNFDNPGKVAVEFRHKKWFTDEIKHLLTEVGAVFCNIDSPKIKLMDWLTSDKAYIRMHGRGRWYSTEYSEQDLKEVYDLSKKMIELGAKKIYIFFNNDFGGFATKNALRLGEMLKH